jgi:hypothetical protein
MSQLKQYGRVKCQITLSSRGISDEFGYLSHPSPNTVVNIGVKVGHKQTISFLVG